MIISINRPYIYGRFKSHQEVIDQNEEELSYNRKKRERERQRERKKKRERDRDREREREGFMIIAKPLSFFSLSINDLIIRELLLQMRN